MAEKVDLDTIMAKDADDEALKKYKEALVGNPTDNIIDEFDPRQVFFDKLILIPKDSKIRPIELDVAFLDKGTTAFVIKQGESYNIQIQFRVQRDIVLGLKKFDSISRKGFYFSPKIVFLLI